MRRAPPLTEMQLRRLKHKDTQYVVSCGDGLMLLVGKRRRDGGGTKSWRFEFRSNGKTYLRTLGNFPAMSVQQARAAREWARIALQKWRRDNDPEFWRRDTSIANATDDQLVEELRRRGLAGKETMHV